MGTQEGEGETVKVRWLRISKLMTDAKPQFPRNGKKDKYQKRLPLDISYLNFKNPKRKYWKEPEGKCTFPTKRIRINISSETKQARRRWRKVFKIFKEKLKQELKSSEIILEKRQRKSISQVNKNAGNVCRQTWPQELLTQILRGQWCCFKN